MYGWAPAQWFPCRSDAQLVTVMKAAGQSHRKQGGGRWGVEGVEGGGRVGAGMGVLPPPQFRSQQK